MKFKLKWLAAMSLLLAVVLTGCKSNDGWKPAGMKLISTDVVDYELFVPDSWISDLSTGVVSAYVSNLDRSNITMMAFNLEGDHVYATAAEYWASYEEELKATFPDMEYIGEPESMLIGTDSRDGVTAAAMKYTYTATITGVQYQFMQVIFIHANIAYTFTYTATPENFQNHVDDVNSILAFFTFYK